MHLFKLVPTVKLGIITLCGGVDKNPTLNTDNKKIWRKITNNQSINSSTTTHLQLLQYAWFVSFNAL